MYKNQLQELAQRSCFNLPSYTSIREGPDHTPRFKAIVNFNGETFESPHFFSTLRQAEHAAAEVALNSLSSRGPSHSLAARVLDETGVYKNLLQEISQRVGAPLPHYTTYRSWLGHQPVFTGLVELAGISFTGEPGKNKKQAEKNVALAAWTCLKQLAQEQSSNSSSMEAENSTDEMEQVTISRALSNYRLSENITNSTSPPVPFPQNFPIPNFRPASPQRLRHPAPTSKILPLIFSKQHLHQHQQHTGPFAKDIATTPHTRVGPPKFPAHAAPPYFPIRYLRAPCTNIAPPVTIRSAVPCYSAPGPPPVSKPGAPSPMIYASPPVRIVPPVQIRPAVPVCAAPPVTIRKMEAAAVRPTPATLMKLTTMRPFRHPNVVAERTETCGLGPGGGNAKVEEDKVKSTEAEGNQEESRGCAGVERELEQLKI